MITIGYSGKSNEELEKEYRRELILSLIIIAMVVIITTLVVFIVATCNH